jgi:tRNA threonylcarbamoyladenosine biosynthesis protein TsaB
LYRAEGERPRGKLAPMRILALDSSTDWLSIALYDGAAWLVRAERAGNAASERALPLIGDLLATTGRTLGDLDGIAFGAGPGAFTGVRIACGLALGLALGASLPVLGVPTLEALAEAAWRERGATSVLACLDARMREVYVAAYRRERDGWREELAPAVLKPGDVEPPPGAWHGCGDGFAAYPELVARLELASVDAAAVPSARAIGQIALPRFAAGEGVPADRAEPVYVRHRVALTSAERAAGERL